MTITNILGLTSIMVFYLFMVSPRETGVTYLLSPVSRLSRTFVTNVYKRFYGRPA